MNKSNFFWVGYSDLMTSLFFIMLVLFVVTIGMFQIESKELDIERKKLKIQSEELESKRTENEKLIESLKKAKLASEAQLKKIEELRTSVNHLPSTYFSYQPAYKRFVLNKKIEFESGSYIIKSKDYKYLIDVGNSITSLVDSLNKIEKFKEFDIKYLVVIEGMASRSKDKFEYNFELSYSRALSLYKLWKSNNILFDPKFCEVQIAGSGTDGVREYSGIEEKKNQRFLINIVPKMGEISGQ